MLVGVEGAVEDEGRMSIEPLEGVRSFKAIGCSFSDPRRDWDLSEALLLRRSKISRMLG